MKTDLDALMAERGFDALLILGEARGNHFLQYLSGGARVTHATVLKQRGQAPLILCNPMERDEAAINGNRVITSNELNFPAILAELRNVFEAELMVLKGLLEGQGVSGSVAVYGMMDPGKAFVTLKRLAEMLPTISFTGETEVSIFDLAYSTKGSDELSGLRDVAARSNQVMAEVMDFVKSHRAKGETLLKRDGSPLTVGDVKRYLRERLAAQGLSDDGSTIFAIGRDAGVPHSRGQDADPLTLGRTIIFDLFPYALDSGFYHDMTRTFCLGHAPEEIKLAYAQVMQAFDASIDAIRLGEKCARLQEVVCDVFEEHGHPTPRSKPGTVEGYVHSVGHGLGLQIHERPKFGAVSEDLMQAEQVFTVEPGLYYPDQGWGIRVEDTVYVDAAGRVHSLTPFPKDLVIPIDTDH